MPAPSSRVPLSLRTSPLAAVIGLLALGGVVACNTTPSVPPAHHGADEAGGHPPDGAGASHHDKGPGHDEGPGHDDARAEPPNKDLEQGPGHDGGGKDPGKGPGTPDGATATACSTAADCPANYLCEGQGCGEMEGQCQPPDRPCTRDLRPYCGCDGKTFQSSGSCPGKRFSRKGACEQQG